MPTINRPLFNIFSHNIRQLNECADSVAMVVVSNLEATTENLLYKRLY